MKSRIIFLGIIFLIYATPGISQITIKNTDMPSSGDTLRVSNARLDSVGDLTKTGANYTWDFSKLKANEQEVIEYKPSSKTPYAFYFFGANKFGVKIIDSINLGMVQLYDVYDFYQNTTTAFVTEGRGIKFSGFPLGSFYTDKDEIYQFPLDYKDRDSSTFQYAIDLLTFASYSTYGYRINEVDGWGNITTPYGTYNCLRVKTSIFSHDTIKISGMPIGIINRSVEYKWLAKNEKFPILEIKGNEGPLGFTPTSIKFRDKWRKTYNPFAPKADFIASPLNPTTVDVVSFTNLTQNAGIQPAYSWKFNPSNVKYQEGTNAGSSDPKVIFTKAGNYSVQLFISGISGKHDTIKTDYIKVTDASIYAPKADFSANKLTPAVNDYVEMTNLTTNSSGTKYIWTFTPDNVTYKSGDNTSESPIVIFSQEGLYTVSLKATNNYGTDVSTKTNYINVSGTTSLMNEGNLSIDIFPNPTDGFLKINMTRKEEIIEANFISIDGKFSEKINQNDILIGEIDMLAFPAGLYVLKVLTTTNSYKFFIQKN